MANDINETAGQADPYWYEWFVGLVEVMNLLDPNKGVDSVAFQVSSIKVWDDVVVTTKSGRRLYQIKHTREDENITFGSLVQKDKKSNSLLKALFEGWIESSLDDPSNSLILYTNRCDGTRSWKHRPPLLEFWNWLKGELSNALGYDDINVPTKYEDGWKEWLECFNSAGQSEAIAFWKQLEIRTREDDLDGLESRIRQSLAKAFGVSLEKSAPLFDSLNRELRKWTTGHPGVTVEGLFDALAVKPEDKELSQAPPPPTPFFPTRTPVAESLESDLRSIDEPPVIFLTGEPGSGKTSTVSWLANRRTNEPFQGVIGLRFFCFEPIRPEQPFIAPDSSRVKPEELWFSLLSQLRLGLKGRLHELSVPISNSILNWSEARAHVIRIADALGSELGRKFVISIDGIDHAARAAQVLPEEIGNFFASLPAPDEIQDKSIRLFIAGQPPEYYSKSYPTWLRTDHPLVRRIDLPKLQLADIRTLLEAADTTIPPNQFNECVRLINELAKGNTLAVVFAVAESEHVNTLEELQERLENRSLSSGLSTYYDSIWNHALQKAPELNCCLAAAISLARRPLTAVQLASAFSGWNKPEPWWREVLADLGPLLVATDRGYQIRHNDVRVFLAEKFQACSADRKTSATSQLATYYRSNDCDRLAAHLQLFELLRLSGREAESSEVFNVDWVFEGVVLGVGFQQLQYEGELAAKRLSENGNWSNVVSVACALQTLRRLMDAAEFDEHVESRATVLPPFLPSEAMVRPLSQWSTDDFRRLVYDASELIDAGEHDRARGLLERWLAGLSINEVIRSLPNVAKTIGRIGNDSEPRLDNMVVADFESLGSVCGDLQWEMVATLNSDTSNLEHDAVFAFEKGFVNAVTLEPQFATLKQLFAAYKPRYSENHELVVRNLAKSEAWDLVAETLGKLGADKHSTEFQAEATWFALRSGLHETQPEWLEPLNEDGYGLPAAAITRTEFEPGNYDPHLRICRALGWTRPGFDVAEIADSVCKVFAPTGKLKDSPEFQLIFQGSATLGRIEGLSSEKGWQVAAESVSADKIGQLLSLIWSRSWQSGLYRTAAKIAAQLAEFCEQLGHEHQNAALEAAMPLAKKHVLGPRNHAIWNVLLRRGRLDILREWTSHYLSPEGELWTWNEPNSSIRETVDEICQLAISIGQTDLADYARQRASWLRISYAHRKEYSFEEALHWFAKAAENDPQVWANQGWRLWQLCEKCRDKDGDNRFERQILSSISAAAIHCGASAWWRLISTTFERACHRDWHWATRERLVEGIKLAIEQEIRIPVGDVLPIWSLALAMSYWFDNGDNSSLLETRGRLLDYVPDARKNEFDLQLQQVSPSLTRGDATDESELTDLGDEKTLPRQPPSKFRADDDFWSELNQQLMQLDNEDRRWGYSDKLFSIARERAFLHGNEIILSGLQTQLDMHTRWTFGGGELNEIEWKTLPEEQESVTWERVAIEFLKVLLKSHSSEVLAAALEGMHALVDQNPEIVAVLFDEVDDEWSQRWLLNAAEAWAVRHPQSIASIRQHLQHAMTVGDLDAKLQAWVVLSRNCDVLGEDRIPFPIPETAALSPSEIAANETHILDIPPNQQGASILANRFSSARSMLNYFDAFEFDFWQLEGVIANKLLELQDIEAAPIQGRGPHRYGDFFCVPLDTEKAVGHAISQVLSSEWCAQKEIAQLSQAFLPNEDSWIYRTRPQAIASPDEWPSEGEFGADEATKSVRENRMIRAASASLDQGWQVFAAHVVDFTYKADFVLRYWFEPQQSNLQLIKPPQFVTCPGGRSFIWWIGEPHQLNVGDFVSGLFVGGRQRLCHSYFEIRPPTTWRSDFGWEPNVENPLEWLYEGKPVAKYERLHGLLRDNSGSPNYRQPLINRWLITNDALEQLKSIVGEMRARSTFDSAPFDS